jgi:hypothetical protein
LEVGSQEFRVGPNSRLPTPNSQLQTPNPATPAAQIAHTNCAVEIPGYDIIGELAVDQDAQRYLARRTEDGADVLIAVVNAPEGDEGNALNHLASDVKLQMAQPHHGVLRVLDGHWLGESFAVVTQRPAAPTLEEMLVRRDEEFPFVRIATVLRDINGALVWARERGIVHRAIRLENVFVEPGSDRTVVAFNVRPIGLTGMPTEAEDNRTIAGLASAMFTRGRRSESDESLAEQRPGLPASLVTQTEALLGRPVEGDESPLPDMTSYIASIAMADSLKAAEEHLEKNRHLIEQQQQEHQAQLEKERAEHADALAKEKAAHQKEREAHARDLEAYARDKEVLRIERESHERDRELLRRERTEHDKEMSAILAQKARQRTRQGVELVARGWRRRPMWSRRWVSNWKTTAPIIAAGALVLVAAVALSNRDGSPAPIRVDSAAGQVARTPTPAAVPLAASTPVDSAPAAPVDSATATPAATAVVDSAAPTNTIVAPGVPAAFAASVKSRADSLWAERAKIGWYPERAPRREPVAPRPTRQVDTIFTAPVLPPRDSTVRDTTARDTLPTRPDSLVRRESLSRQ